MIQRLRVVQSAEVEAWAAKPHTDGGRATQIRVKFERAMRVISTAGSLAGDDFLKKVPGHDGLFETRVNDFRVFSTIRGNQIYMASVVEKKKGRLSTKVLGVQLERVTAFADARSGQG